MLKQISLAAAVLAVIVAAMPLTAEAGRRADRKAAKKGPQIIEVNIIAPAMVPQTRYVPVPVVQQPQYIPVPVAMPQYAPQPQPQYAAQPAQYAAPAPQYAPGPAPQFAPPAPQYAPAPAPQPVVAPQPQNDFSEVVETRTTVETRRIFNRPTAPSAADMQQIYMSAAPR